MLQLDYLLMLVGALCAAGAGVIMPLFSIVFGDILDAFHGSDPTSEVCTLAFIATVRSISGKG